MESKKKNQPTDGQISNGHIKNASINTKNSPIKYRKVFEPRESLLTILISSNSHIRSLYNLIIGFVAIFTISTIGDYISNPDKFRSDYSIFWWTIRDIYPHFILVWFVLNAVLFMVHYPLIVYRHSAQSRKLLQLIKKSQPTTNNNGPKNRSKSQNKQQLDLDKLYTDLVHNGISLNGWQSGLIAMVYSLELTTMTLYSVWYIVHYNVNVAMSFALSMELCRLLMKSHSYFIEKMSLSVSKTELEKISDSIQNSKSKNVVNQNIVSRPKLSSFVYFLFAPTLIYRDSYPRTEGINWDVVAWNSIQMVMVILIWFVIVLRFLVDNLSTTGDLPFNVSHFSHNLSNLFLYGVVTFFLIFYGFLQLWHNLTAELLRFADRHYYDAWWESISLNEFYRKWNQLVQEWLFTYIYVPVYNWTKNRSIATYSVIFLSGVGHEIIIVLSIKFFFPLLFIAFSIGGHLWYLLSKNLRRNSTAHLHNTMFMASYIMGWGMISAIYTVEWYSRTNCPLTQNSTLMESMIPRMVSCVKIE